MNHDDLKYLLEHSAAVRLLRAQNAPFILSALYRLFRRDSQHRWSVALSDAVDSIGALLVVLNDPEERYPNSAENYLKAWASDDSGWVRVVRRDDGDWVELTPESERALGWLQDMNQRTFVGTESRFMSIFHLLEEIAIRSNEDPQARIEQLEVQRAQLDVEIERIRQTGQVETLTPTQVRERFYQVVDLSNGLLRDFASVEQSFREVARQVRDAQLEPDARKGSIIQTVLDTDERLRDSDEGRSFDSFWQVLRSPQKQAELVGLIEAVFALPEIQDDALKHSGLRRITRHLLDAGNKIVESNRRLAEHLRRALDEAHMEESRRVRELVNEIKRAAHRLSTSPPQQTNFIWVEHAPDLNFVMERPLWRKKEPVIFETMPQEAEAADLSALLNLYTNRFFVSEEELISRIQEGLQRVDCMTLHDVIQLHPVEQGIAEVLTYLSIALNTAPHRLVPDEWELIPVALQDQPARVFRVPKVEFRRKPL